MPNIGDTVTGKEINIKSPYNRFIWTACIDCGKERWVMIVRGKPRKLKCQSCSQTKPITTLDTSYTPKLGEIRYAREIGKQSSKNRSNRYIWISCPDCKKGRWALDRKRMPLFCKVCNAHRCGALSKKSGEQHHFWKGGRYKSLGYIYVYLNPGDFFYPMVNESHYVREHRLVMAKFLNRCLLSWEVVHHINGIKTDNRIENLKLIGCSGEHNTATERILLRQAKEIKALQASLVVLLAVLQPHQ